jgi:hypothetical protein
MTNVDPIGATAPSPVFDTAAAERRGHRAEQFAITGLEGNAPTLVEIAAAPDTGVVEIVILSRDRRAHAAFTPAEGEPLIVPLAAGDYLLVARPTPGSRANRAIRRRILVDAGRAYGYDLPLPLAALPAARPDLDAAAPALTRLAYTGSVDRSARLVVAWSSESAALCLCIRSPQWGEEWLPYAISSAAAFCLCDGAYEIRAAQLAEDGTRLGAWSDVTELVIAEGRLAAAPSEGGGDVLDWIGAKRGWRPDGITELHAAGSAGGKVAVRLAWQAAASAAGLRYVIAYRRDSGGEWETAIAACPEQTLWLAPGRYRVRICAVDDAVFLRSEFFAEGVITVSASDSPVLRPADVADASVGWRPLPEAGASMDTEQDAALQEFIAGPISGLAAGQARSAVDLTALAYGQPGGHSADIAVARALARGVLAPDQMAAAGDYFLRAGRLDTARQVFEELGRRYRGVDYAQLRCAQLAAISGRGNEARELLTLALLPAKDDPTRSQTLGSAVSKAARDHARVRQQAARDATASADLVAARQSAPDNKAPQYAALLEELPALRFKAQQYDRLMRELPTLRYKARLYDEAKSGRTAGRGNGVVQRLRRWSARLPGLRLR